MWCDVWCLFDVCIKAQPYRYGFYMHAANDYATRLHACLPKICVCIGIYSRSSVIWLYANFFSNLNTNKKKIRGFKVNCVSVCVM